MPSALPILNLLKFEKHYYIFIHVCITYIEEINILIKIKASLTASNVKLYGYSGFDPTLCYGDILLSYVWASSQLSDHTINDSGKKENAEIVKAQQNQNEEVIDKKMHDFIRTHFHRATHCDFCTKKVTILIFFKLNI